MASYGFHGVHGRAMPIATGIKVANPDLKVLAMGGDGDAFAIGGGHFVHAARRNLDICYVIMDNNIYGLTKGQTSPTSQVGFVTKTTPKGTPDRPINPLRLAIASGATFVARGFSGKPKELAELIVEGIDHNGFAVIDTFSPCPTFNKVNTFKVVPRGGRRPAEGPRSVGHAQGDRGGLVDGPDVPRACCTASRARASRTTWRRRRSAARQNASKVMENLFKIYS